MGLKLASARSLRGPGSPELGLASAPRSRLGPVLLGILLGSGFIALKGGASWMMLSASMLGGLVVVLAVVAGLTRRRLRLDGSMLILEGSVFGLRRVSGRLDHNRRVWIGSTSGQAHSPYRRRVPVEIRIVGERGRLTWHVGGSTAAARELELLREFLPRAGVKLLRDDAVLAGGVDVSHNAERTLLSWRARLPTTGRRGIAFLALLLVLLVGLTSVPGQSPVVATIHLSVLLGTALSLAIVAVRARRARASIEVSDQGWNLVRSGLFSAHRYVGGRARLPGRVIGLHGSLPLETSLELEQGAARVLDPAELSPPEMRWLAARVVDRLERDYHSEPRHGAARLVI